MFVNSLQNIDFSVPAGAIDSATIDGTFIAHKWQKQFQNNHDANGAIIASPHREGERAQGICIQTDSLGGWMRVYQELEIFRVPFGQAVQVELNLDSAHKNRIAWIAILYSTENKKWLFHSKIAENIEVEGPVRCVYDAKIAPPVKGAKYYFVIHFEQEIDNLIIKKCSMKYQVSLRPFNDEASQNKSPDSYNLAFFWKQNDSGIYGRRQDMLVKYLLRSEKISKIVHFDAPIPLDRLQANMQLGEGSQFSQGNLVVKNTIERYLKLQDEPSIARRVFLYAQERGEAFMGRTLPTIEDYPDFVEACLTEEGVVDNIAAWVCPVCPDFSDVRQRIPFRFIVSDVIDDQLAWESRPDRAKAIKENYQDVVGNSDVVFANCRAVQEAMLPLNRNTYLIPNAAEIFPENVRWKETPKLEGIKRPIVGYVGNLNARIDSGLLAKVAEEHPEWSIVLIGSSHLNTDIFHLAKYPNIHLLGVMPYAEALNYIAEFDVAIIPHEVNNITRSMNPLKLYVYASVGVPIVTTAIDNIGDITENVYVSATSQEFIDNITRALDKTKPFQRISRREMVACSWQRRVTSIIDLLPSKITV